MKPVYSATTEATTEAEFHIDANFAVLEIININLEGESEAAV